MGLLTVTYGGKILPVKITNVNRHISPSVSNVIQSYETKNGSEFLYSKRESKRIEIEYRIKNKSAASLAKFRREMAGMLVKDTLAKLVFSDEPNKYYEAILDGEPTLEESYLESSGSIAFLVPDGIAHATTEKTFLASTEGDILKTTIINEGTESVPIDFDITNNHENGYIGIVSKYGAIQLGKAEEADGETYKASEVLAKGFGKFAADHGTSAQNPSNTTSGTLEVRDVAGNNCLLLAGGQSGSTNWWNGGMKTLTIPADSEGMTGAKNFYCYTQHWFETGLMGQTGAQTIAFLTGDNQVICAMSINKSDLVGNMAHVDWFGPKNKLLKSIDFSPTNGEGNPYNLKMGGGHNDFLKEGDRLRIFWYGQYFTYTLPEIKNMECKKVQIWIGQWGNRNLGNQYVTRNYIKHFSFTKNNVEKYRDIPNRYSAGDKIYIDGNSTSIYVNGMKRNSDEILGSDYFLVPPGETEIQFSYSTFSNPAPTITAKIREAWL